MNNEQKLEEKKIKALENIGTQIGWSNWWLFSIYFMLILHNCTASLN